MEVSLDLWESCGAFLTGIRPSGCLCSLCRHHMPVEHVSCLLADCCCNLQDHASLVLGFSSPHHGVCGCWRVFLHWSVCDKYTAKQQFFFCCEVNICCFYSFLEGIKDNAQTYCMIGAGVGAGKLVLCSRAMPGTMQHLWLTFSPNPYRSPCSADLWTPDFGKHITVSVNLVKHVW